MSYDPKEIIEAFERNAQIEDESEKRPSLRVEPLSLAVNCRPD